MTKIWIRETYGENTRTNDPRRLVDLVDIVSCEAFVMIPLVLRTAPIILSLVERKHWRKKNIWVFSENSGFSPQIIHGLIGFSIVFTIHFGVPLFLETPIYIGKRGKTRHPRCADVPNISRIQFMLRFLVSIHQLVLTENHRFIAWSFFGKFV